MHMLSRHTKAFRIAAALVVDRDSDRGWHSERSRWRPREIEISPADDFSESLEIDVLVAGLDAFEGGTASVYLCGNADSTGNSITPTADDCFAPGADGYVVGNYQLC